MPEDVHRDDEPVDVDGAFARAPMAVAELDSRERIVRVNPAFVRLFGWTAHEVVGHPATALLERDDAGWRARTRDGSLPPVEVEVWPVANLARMVVSFRPAPVEEEIIDLRDEVRRLVHDLRGPAGAIVLASATLEAGHATMTPEQLAVAAATLASAARRLQELLPGSAPQRPAVAA